MCDDRDAAFEAGFVDVAEAILEDIGRYDAAFHGQREPVALDIRIEQRLVFQCHLNRQFRVFGHVLNALDGRTDKALYRVGMLLKECRRGGEAVAIKIEAVVPV